jgi:phospholipid/cholesterol/gamma-HCH transport system ATP-binding protein
MEVIRYLDEMPVPNMCCERVRSFAGPFHDGRRDEYTRPDTVASMDPQSEPGRLRQHCEFSGSASTSIVIANVERGATGGTISMKYGQNGEMTVPGGQPASQQGAVSPAVVFDNVWLAFDEHVVLRGISFTLPKGSMRILMGASGAGKSLVLKLILGLLRPDSGSIHVNGERIDNMDERDLLRIRADIGMLFQETALFDSLTVAENVGYRLYEETDMPVDQVRRRIDEVLGFIGLGEYVDRMPSELSGGQRRRVAIARAIASKPNLLLFDDPTTGLDPIIAATVDDEIVKLRDLEQVTSIVVTHQIRDAFYVATHEAVRTNGRLQILPADEAKAAEAGFMLLHEGGIQFEGSAAELLACGDGYLQRFLYRTLPPW